MVKHLKKNSDEYIVKLQDEIYVIFKEIVRICDENNLKYYLIAGTLLGAVRHKGFIPWDDDLDIGMPREDFNKFVNIYYKELKEPFALNWINVNPDYPLLFAKVENKNTVLRWPYTSYGIFVDIFPLDEVFGYSKNVEKRKSFSGFFGEVLFRKATNQKKGMPMHKQLLAKIFSCKKLNDFATRFMTMTNNKNAGYYTNFPSTYRVKKDTVPKDYYGDGVMLQFGDDEYRVPTKYVDVLVSVFGEDYMTPPPPEKRGHHNIRQIIFSDGEEILIDY